MISPVSTRSLTQQRQAAAPRQKRAAMARSLAALPIFAIVAGLSGMGAKAEDAKPAAAAPAAAAPSAAPAPGGAVPAPTPSAAPAGGAAAPAATPPEKDPAQLKTEDCTFIEGAFVRINTQLNERAVNPGPETMPLLSIFADLQRNLILLHQGRGCDPAKLVEIIRAEPPASRRTAAATAPAERQPEAAADAPLEPRSAEAVPTREPPPERMVRQERPRPVEPPRIEVEPVREAFSIKRSVNVRAFPDAKSDKIATLQGGRPAPVLGKVRGRDWYLVELPGGRQGFIYGSYLEPLREARAASAMTGPAPAGMAPAGSAQRPSQGSAQGSARNASAAAAGAVSALSGGKPGEADLRRAAEGGDAKAQFELGNSYVDRDMFEAVGWWQAAADRGHAGAQYNLGVAFMRGGVLPKDNAKAIEWFRKASATGHQGAKKALESLGQQ